MAINVEEYPLNPRNPLLIGFSLYQTNLWLMVGPPCPPKRGDYGSFVSSSSAQLALSSPAVCAARAAA